MHQVKADKFQPQIYASPTEALLKTKRIWEVLADQPDLNKSGVYHLLDLPKDSHDCPCCQYNLQETEKLLEETGTEREACHFCPIYPESDYGCDQDGQPYRNWVNAIDQGSLEGKKEAATTFLSLVNSTLSKNGGK